MTMHGCNSKALRGKNRTERANECSNKGGRNSARRLPQQRRGKGISQGQLAASIVVEVLNGETGIVPGRNYRESLLCPTVLLYRILPHNKPVRSSFDQARSGASSRYPVCNLLARCSRGGWRQGSGSTGRSRG